VKLDLGRMKEEKEKDTMSPVCGIPNLSYFFF